MRARFIVVWRKPPPEHVLEWSHHPCFDLDEVEQVVKNITAQGVHQYHTFPLGQMIPEFSSRC